MTMIVEKALLIIGISSIVAMIMWPCLAFLWRIFKPDDRASIFALLSFYLLPVFIACVWTGDLQVSFHGPLSLSNLTAGREVPMEIESPGLSASIDKAVLTSPTTNARKVSVALDEPEVLSSKSRSILPILHVFFGLYIAGVLSAIGYPCIRLFRLRRNTRSFTSGRIERITGELVTSMAIRQKPRLAASNASNAPMILGLFRPQIVMPVDATEWSDHELALAIGHELAHLKRRDHIIVAVGILVSSILFFHPCTFWVRRQLRLALETQADWLVVESTGDPSAYATFLLSFAVGVTGVSSGGISIKSYIRERISRITDMRRSKMKKGFRSALTVTSSLLLAVVLIWFAAPSVSARPASE